MDVYPYPEAHCAGNIEIWHPVHVPIGAVHVSGSARLARMAESLGIEHAPAVVGFQHNDSGFAVPVMDGVVVLEGMEGMRSPACGSPSSVCDTVCVHGRSSTGSI